jgi:2'-5' RNA ligase
MFEIEDEDRRRRILSTLGGVEETATLTFAGETVKGVPEADVDRSTAEGKASSVQFIHFPFTLEQIEKFRRPNTQVVVGLSHPKYAHMAIMPEEVRATLAGDFE